MPYFKSEVALLFLGLHGITVDRSLFDKDNRRGTRCISEPQMGIKTHNFCMIASERHSRTVELIKRALLSIYFYYVLNMRN